MARSGKEGARHLMMGQRRNRLFHQLRRWRRDSILRYARSHAFCEGSSKMFYWSASRFITQSNQFKFTWES